MKHAWREAEVLYNVYKQKYYDHTKYEITIKHKLMIKKNLTRNEYENKTHILLM